MGEEGSGNSTVDIRKKTKDKDLEVLLNMGCITNWFGDVIWCL